MRKLFSMMLAVVVLVAGCYLHVDEYGNTSIQPTVVSNAPSVVVPSVVGQNYLGARNIVKQQGLNVNKVMINSNAPINSVVSQNPMGGATLPQGGIVTLRVSRGMATQVTSRVPSVVGKTEISAKNTLRARGYNANVVNVQGVGRSNVVISQNPAANYALAKGGTVTINVRRPQVKPQAGMVIVPNIVNLKPSYARTKLLRAGLKLGNTTYRNGRAGYILSQAPYAGRSLPRGSVINIVVGQKNISPGNDMKITAPNVVGKTLAQARAIILGRKLKLTNISYRVSPLVGKVISQTPPANSAISVGRGMAIVIGKAQSTSSNTTRVTLPNLNGKTAVVARNYLRSIGLNLGSTSYATGTPGKVIGQNPAAGSRLPRGTSVNIVIGKAAPSNNGGNTNVRVPSLSGQTAGSASVILKRMGLALGSASYATGTPGKIIRQNPSAGASVPKGTRVSIVIGKAAPSNTGGNNAGGNSGGATMVVVPNVVNMPITSINSMFKKAGVVLGKVSYRKTSKRLVRKVLSQSIKAGTKVAKGTQINLVVGR